jgi:hypothetical protein
VLITIILPLRDFKIVSQQKNDFKHKLMNKLFREILKSFRHIPARSRKLRDRSGIVSGLFRKAPVNWENIPSGKRNVPALCGNIAGYSENIPPWFRNIPPWFRNVPANGREVPEGSGNIARWFSKTPVSWSSMPSGFGNIPP